jgi:DNA-directed RNA polymerase subunit RPC12/RpoP
LNDSTIRLACPLCGAENVAAADMAGSFISCRRCEHKMLVPGVKVAASPAIDELVSFNEESEPVTSQSPSDPDMPELLDWSHYRKKKQDAQADETGEPAEREPVPVLPATTAPEGHATGEEDDLGDLLKDFSKPPASRTEPVGRDPFKANPDAALRIEGISPEENEFRVVCNICGSLMYARPSQIGSHIKCHDCYSPVLVHPPRESPKKPAWPGAPARSDDNECDEDSGPEYKLRPAEDIAPIDTTIDRSLEAIDYDDDDFFRQKRELEEALAMQEPPVVDVELVSDLPDEPPAGGAPAANEAEDEYRLATSDEPALRKPVSAVTFDDLDDLMESWPAATPVTGPSADGDLAANRKQEINPASEVPVRVAPVATQPEQTERKGPVAASSTRETAKSPAAPVAYEQTSSRTPTPQPTSGAAKGEPRKQDKESLRARWEQQNQKSLPADDIASPIAGFGSWLMSSLRVATRIDNLIRLAIATILLGFSNMLFFSGLAKIMVEEPTVTARITGGFLIAFGAIPMVLIYLAVIAHSNSIILNAVEGTSEAEEGLDLSPSEWFGRFIYVAPSFFAGALPGFVMGQAIFIGGGSFAWVVVFGILSGILITPVFIASAMYNGNPWQLVSGEVFVAFLRLPWRVIRFAIFGLVLGGAITGCLYAAQFGIIAAFAFPALAVLIAFNAWWMMGDLIGVVNRNAEKTTAEKAASAGR